MAYCYSTSCHGYQAVPHQGVCMNGYQTACSPGSTMLAFQVDVSSSGSSGGVSGHVTGSLARPQIPPFQGHGSFEELEPQTAHKSLDEQLYDWKVAQLHAKSVESVSGRMVATKRSTSGCLACHSWIC